MESYLGNLNLKKVNQPKEWTQKEIEEYKEYIQEAKRLKIAEAKAEVFKSFLKGL